LEEIAQQDLIHKSAKQAPGFKAWKDRQTLILCGTAAGHMIKPGVVYHAKNPPTVKNKNKQFIWQHNLKAWVMTVLFTKWFQHCFIPKVKE
jgi:uncharacterized protein CbrC (UPF0167 family)